ncbi:Peptidase M23 [uncultured Caudovirales phage]|uniref:Peptidase M23 n=1 Tax=uncultured Caudovirales phage TaxID=2100421 RepID=A0A6J7WNK6_9CAUD|nr:Peptidase M23 [uncultured Caudovirales phage]
MPNGNGVLADLTSISSMLDKILQQISGIETGAKGAGQAVQGAASGASSGGRPAGGDMMSGALGTVSSGSALPNSGNVNDYLAKNTSVEQARIVAGGGRPMPTGISKQEIGLGAISAAVGIGATAVKTTFAMMPNVDATIARMSDYYSAGLRQPGMSIAGMQSLAQSTGLYKTGQDGAVMKYLSSQGVSMSSSLGTQQMTQIASASNVLGMDPMQAAQMVSGLTSGQGSANMMRNFGIYTSDPTTGKPLTQNQIFQQIHGQFSAGRGKASVEDVKSSYYRGNLGASLQASGLDQATQDTYYLWELAKAQGQNLDLSNPQAMEAYRQSQIKSGNVNPNESAQTINQSTAETMNTYQDQYLNGLKDAARLIQDFNNALKGMPDYLKSANGFLGMAAGNNPLGAVLGGASNILGQVGTFALGTWALKKFPIGKTPGGGPKGVPEVPPVVEPVAGPGPVGSGEVKVAQEAAAAEKAAADAAAASGKATSAVSGVAKEASALEKIFGSLSKVLGPASKVAGEAAWPLAVAQVGLEAANKSVEYGKQALKDPTKNTFETAQKENANNWDSMNPFGKTNSGLQEKSNSQLASGDFLGALGTQANIAYNMSPLNAIGILGTGVANYIGATQVELNKGQINTAPTPPPGYVHNSNGTWSDPAGNFSWDPNTNSVHLSGSGATGGTSSTVGTGANSSGTGTSTSGQLGSQTKPSKPSFIMPINDKINEKFGPRDTTGMPNASKYHHGIDINAPRPTPVAATATGTVLWSRFETMGGNVIMLQHDAGYRSRYLHLSQSNVRDGQRIVQGQIIGVSGDTGTACYGAHLHFEIHKDGSPIDPLTVMGAGTGVDMSLLSQMQQQQQPQNSTPAANAPTTQESVISSISAKVAGAIQVGGIGSSASAGGGAASTAPVSSRSGANSATMPNPAASGGRSGGAASSGKGGDDKNQMRLGSFGGEHQGGSDQMHMWRSTLNEVMANVGKRQPNNVTINVTVAQASQAEAQKLAEMVKQYLENDELLTNMARR